MRVAAPARPPTTRRDRVKSYALCGYCRQSTRLRESGSDQVKGTLWRHRRRGDGLWCEGGGELPPHPTTVAPRTPRSRVECHICYRLTGVRMNGLLYDHNDPHSHVPCMGSGVKAVDDRDNTTIGLSGGGPIGCWPPFTERDDEETPTELLTDWWIQKARQEADMVCEKAIAYGATDLRDLGRQILEMAGRPGTDDDGYATEIGITFYAQGKLARIVAAVKEGRQPNVDSWLDLGVYARMAQRVHETGGWPGT